MIVIDDFVKDLSLLDSFQPETGWWEEKMVGRLVEINGTDRLPASGAVYLAGSASIPL